MRVARELGWDRAAAISPMSEYRARHRYPRLSHRRSEPEHELGTCLACGQGIAPPVTEVFWCHAGCRRAWDLALVQEALRRAQRLLRDCDKTPERPQPGYPQLPEAS